MSGSDFPSVALEATVGEAFQVAVEVVVLAGVSVEAEWQVAPEEVFAVVEPEVESMAPTLKGSLYFGCLMDFP